MDYLNVLVLADFNQKTDVASEIVERYKQPEHHHKILKGENYTTGSYHSLYDPNITSIVDAPVRSSSYQLNTDGKFYGAPELPISLLLKLNEITGGAENLNFAQAYSKVVPEIKGSYSFTLSNFSLKPRFILVNHGRELSLNLIFLNGVYMLVWSPNHLVIQKIKDRLVNQDILNFYSARVEFGDNSVLVLHPLYLSSKLLKVNRTCPVPANRRLLAFAYIKEYLQSSAVTNEISN